MKEYKIDLSMYEGKVREVVSEAIQRHAFELGYPGWRRGGKNVRETRAPYLFIETRRMYMTEDDSRNEFMNDNDILISAADFLALTPEDVKDAQKEPEFKPFDRVLVRDFDDGAWIPHFYSHHDEVFTFRHRTIGGVGYQQCIPYEGNEHLLGIEEDVK